MSMKDLSQCGSPATDASTFLEESEGRRNGYRNRFECISNCTFKTTACAFATNVLAGCVVAMVVGTVLILNMNDRKDNYKGSVIETVSPKRPSSSRLTSDSPLYTPPTPSIEGFYRYGAVASDAPHCSTVGSEIMFRHGGSAIDAAIASLLCVGVYQFQSSGIGGGFIMTYYKRETKSKHTIIAREMAPRASTETMFKQDGWNSLEGVKSVTVPGEVKGLYEAWRLGGKLPWVILFQPAIQMCVNGFIVGPALANAIRRNRHYYEKHESLCQMVTNPITNDLYKEGERITLPKLGVSLQKISKDPTTFYNGSLAADIVNDLRDLGGIITLDDLINYNAAVKKALTIDLSSGYTLIAPPPPSSGAVVLLIMNILDGFSFDEESVSTISNAVETYHRIIESFKFGFSIRSLFGDPDIEIKEFKDNLGILLANITSGRFGTDKRELITDKTHDTSYYGPLYSVDAADTGTSHVSVLAPNGDAVSVTSTVNLWFGSKVVGKRTGIVFNDQMDDFSTPNTTNFFGIPASEANFIKPMKRPLSSMSPTIGTNTTSGEVRLVVGASGGSQIITTTSFMLYLKALAMFKVLLETLLFNLGVKEAVDMPRFHHQLLPDEIYVEDGFQQVLRDGLIARGHKFSDKGEFFSVVQALLQRKHGHIFANCDYEKYGAPDGA